VHRQCFNSPDDPNGSAYKKGVSVRAHSQAFFSSLFLARLADQILLFLVPLVVYQTTKKVSCSGFAFTAETLPRYLFFPILGALCDRISPLKR